MTGFQLHRLHIALRHRAVDCFERAVAADNRHDHLAYHAWSFLERRYTALSCHAYDASVEAYKREQAEQAASRTIPPGARAIAEALSRATGRPVVATTTEADRTPAWRPRARTTREEHLPKGFVLKEFYL